jgi:hypothetical protein
MIRPLDMIGKNTERHSWEIKVSDIWLVKDFPDDTFTGISPYFVFLV